MDPDFPWMKDVLTSYGDLTFLKTEKVTEKGDNFASEILRVTAVDTDNKEVTFILKRIPHDNAKAEYLRSTKFFDKEILMFSTALSVMEDLSKEANINCPWGHCLHFRRFDALIFEDLAAKQFKMIPKTPGLENNSAEQALLILARFHALSAAGVDRKLINPYPDLASSIFSQKRVQLNDYRNECIQNISEVIDLHWGSEWKDSAAKLRTIKNSFLEKMDQVIYSGEEEFKVICHGDFWSNNILFKEEKGNFICAKMVDFQLSFYTKYIYDLVYMFCSSFEEENLLPNLENYLKIYQGELKRVLTKLKFTKKIPALDEIKEDLNTSMVVGLSLATTGLAYLLCDSEESAIDLHDVATEVGGKSVVKLSHKPFLSKLFTKRMKFLLKHFFEPNCLK